MKGIIVAAGYGSRFLPATKTIAKEMLPLIDKPAIAFVVEEFLNSGIEDIIIITSRRKNSMDNYFDKETELENIFTKENATSKLEKIKPYKANICFVRQQEMNGSGDALLQAYPWLGGDDAVIAYPDDVHFGNVPLAKQLIDTYKQSGSKNCVCAAQQIDVDINRYGVFKLADDKKTVLDLVEKPAKGTEPSNFASLGRFLFTNEYFKELTEAYKGFDRSKGEFYHTYGLNRMINKQKVEMCVYSGLRLDTGEPCGYLEAILHYATTKPEYKDILQGFIEKNKL